MSALMKTVISKLQSNAESYLSGDSMKEIGTIISSINEKQNPNEFQQGVLSKYLKLNDLCLDFLLAFSFLSN
jgi:hypothetical protein